MPKQQKLIAELNINGIVSNERTEIANQFNRFFIQSAEELADNFQPVQLKHILRDQTTYFCIKEVDQSETAEVFKQLRKSKAKDNFGLDTAFIKKHSSLLLMPVTHVVNLSIRANSFPKQWKTAIITPVFKSGASDLVSNYRSISILPAPTKNSCQTTC